VEVIYKEGPRAINHYLPVDYNEQDFKDLIAEYDTDKIAESTIARNRKYAQQLSEMVDAGIKARSDVKQKISVQDFVKKLLNFKHNDEECKEILFTLKIEIFETEKLKNCKDNEQKARLRSAKTPVELLSLYNQIDD
jgi:hypothetical protein